MLPDTPCGLDEKKRALSSYKNSLRLSSPSVELRESSTSLWLKIILDCREDVSLRTCLRDACRERNVQSLHACEQLHFVTSNEYRVQG